MLDKAQDRLDRIARQLKTAVDTDFYVKAVDNNLFDDKYFAEVYSDGSVHISYDLVNILDNDELAAILAHEIAHLESPDKNEVIIALGQYYSCGISFRFRFGSSRTKLVKKLLHKEEFYADARAVQILRKAGFKTTGMADALMKSLSFSRIDRWLRNINSLTHPSMNRRITILSELI